MDPASVIQAEPASAKQVRLRDAEHGLRRAGYHICHDRLKAFIWLFEFGGPSASREDDTVHCARLGKLASLYGLQPLLSGCIRFQSIPWPELVVDDVRAVDAQCRFKASVPSLLTSKRKRAASGDAEFEDEDFLRLQSSLTNDRAQQIAPLRDTLNSSSINLKAMFAISKSLLYHLARQGMVIPILEEATAKYGPSNFVKDEGGVSPGSYQVFSLDTAWLQSGSLLTWARPSQAWLLPKLREPDCDSHVRLLPFRWFGEVVDQAKDGTGRRCGEESLEASSKELKIISREESVALLSLNGLEIPESSSWNRVKLHANNDSSEPTALIHWPERLCMPRQDTSIQTIQDSTYSVDPLARAESWFVGRDDRKAQMEAQKREHQEMLASKIPGLGEYKDQGLEVGTRRSRQELQNAAGIYPTPPDGSKFQSSGQSMEAHGKKMSAEGDNTSPDAFPLDESGPAPSAGDETEPPVYYDHLEDDELLGEMGRHMESDNRITEDDFDFFDEPDDDTLPTSQQHPRSKSQEDRSNESATKGESPKLSVLQAAAMDQIAADNALASGPESGSRDSDRMQLGPVLEAQDISTVSKGENGEVESGSSEEEDPRYKALTASKPISEPLDTKYSWSGKFSAGLSDHHRIGSGPSRPFITPNGIPKLVNLAAATHAQGRNLNLRCSIPD